MCPNKNCIKIKLNFAGTFKKDNFSILIVGAQEFLIEKVCGKRMAFLQSIVAF